MTMTVVISRLDRVHALCARVVPEVAAGLGVGPPLQPAAEPEPPGRAEPRRSQPPAG